MTKLCAQQQTEHNTPECRQSVERTACAHNRTPKRYLEQQDKKLYADKTNNQLGGESMKSCTRGPQSGWATAYFSRAQLRSRCQLLLWARMACNSENGRPRGSLRCQTLVSCRLEDSHTRSLLVFDATGVRTLPIMRFIL